MHQSEVPQDQIITYANIIWDYRPLKPDPHQVEVTVDRNKLEYRDNAALSTASLLESELQLNSTISDASKGARFQTLDIFGFSYKHTWVDQNMCKYIPSISYQILEKNTI